MYLCRWIKSEILSYIVQQNKRIMAIKFRVHQKKRNGDGKLYAEFTHKGERLRYATPVTVSPEEWDVKKQAFTGNKLNLNAKISTINKIRRAVEDYALALDYGKCDFTQEAFKNFVDEHTGRVRRVDRLDELIKQYMEYENSRLNDHGIPVTESTKRKYGYLHARIVEYQNDKNRTVYLIDIDKNMMESFREWLTNRYAPNTIRDKFIKPLKAVLKYAEERGYSIKPAYKKYSIPYIKVNHPVFYKSEVQKLIGLDLSDRPNLEDYQIVMLFGIFTGARPSDFTGFTNEDITEAAKGEPAIVFHTRKTHEKVHIPIPIELQRILERRNYQLPKTNENVVARRFKEICQLAGLDRMEQIGRTRAGEFKVTKGHLYQFVDGKTPKRTFVNGHYYGYLGEKWDPWKIADFTGNDYHIILENYVEKLSELEVNAAKYDLE